MIAGVFRTACLGMKLQTDPTVIYGMGKSLTVICASQTCS